MAKKAKKEIELITYEDILGETETGQIKEIPLSELYSFKFHPFQVREDFEQSITEGIVGTSTITLMELL